MDEKNRRLGGLRFCIEAQKSPRSQGNLDGIADDQTGNDLCCPSFFTLVILSCRRQGKKHENEKPDPHFLRARKYSGMPAAMTTIPASTALPKVTAKRT